VFILYSAAFGGFDWLPGKKDLLFSATILPAKVGKKRLMNLAS